MIDSDIIWTEEPSYPVKKYIPYKSDLPPHNIKAVCFDLDGTLVEAQEWHRMAFNMALEEYNCAPLSIDEHVKTFNGLSSLRKLEILRSAGRLSFSTKDDKEFNSLKQKFTIELIEKYCIPTTRVIDTVTFARQAYGPIACVTNCSRKTAELMLSKTKLLDEFDTVVTNNDVDGKIKPHPWPYIKACITIGSDTRETLAIEDNQKGVASAVDARCLIWHLRKFEDLSVKNLMEIVSRFRIRI